MTCDRVEELLAAYQEGGLCPEDAAPVEEHVRTCPACASLLVFLKATSETLAVFPEVEPSADLRAKLRAIPLRETALGRFRRFLLAPSLQPVFAAGSALLALFTFYMVSPDKAQINRAIGREFRRGVAAVEKMTARAGSIKDSVAGYAENTLASLETINPFKRSEDSAR